MSAILLLVVSFTYCSRDNTLVARVGTKKITITEFEGEFAKGKNAEQIKSATLEDKKIFLDGMINRQLKIIGAFQNGVDTTKTVIDQVKDRSRGFMFNRLIELEVIQKVLPESEIKDYYEKTNKEVKIRQIFITFQPNNIEQKKSALNRIKEIYKRLKNREDFEKLAIDVSEDANTAKKGGDKGYLRWGPTSAENPVYVTAFSMKENDISEPIETPNGYYLIKVENIKKIQNPPYEQQKEKIRRQFYSINNKKIEDTYYEYMDKLKAKYKLVLVNESIEMFAKKYLATGADSSAKYEIAEDSLQKKISPLDSFTDSEKNKVIVSFRNGNLTINDLTEELKRYPDYRRPQFRNIEDVQNFINGRLVPPYLLEQEVNAKNISQDKLVKKQVESFRENIMINEIQRIQINNNINITEQDLEGYFKDHNDEYKNPEKREIQQIYVTDKSLAEDIVKRARRGSDFTQLFHRYNQKESLKEKSGKLEIIEGYAGIGKSAFQIGMGEVTDPIKIGEGYSIVKVLNVIAPTYKTYEESKNVVTSKVRRIAYENREKKWIEELRNRINFVVYENNLAKSFKNYTAEQNRAYE